VNGAVEMEVENGWWENKLPWWMTEMAA